MACSDYGQNKPRQVSNIAKNLAGFFIYYLKFSNKLAFFLQF